MALKRYHLTPKKLDPLTNLETAIKTISDYFQTLNFYIEPIEKNKLIKRFTKVLNSCPRHILNSNNMYSLRELIAPDICIHNNDHVLINNHYMASITLKTLAIDPLISFNDIVTYKLLENITIGVELQKPKQRDIKQKLNRKHNILKSTTGLVKELLNDHRYSSTGEKKHQLLTELSHALTYADTSNDSLYY